jgi:hypothetical protein
MQAKEIQKDLERKKREKLEDARAKAAIKAQIEVCLCLSDRYESRIVDAPSSPYVGGRMIPE